MFLNHEYRCIKILLLLKKKLHLNIKTFVSRSISEIQDTFSMFFPFKIGTFVFCIIWPIFNSLTMLFIIFPLKIFHFYYYISFITCTINMNIHSVAVSLIIFPFSIIDITISMDQFTLKVLLCLFILFLMIYLRSTLLRTQNRQAIFTFRNHLSDHFSIHLRRQLQNPVRWARKFLKKI